ncbi:MAG: putative toxin-antitoxin system toxin component, PIN family [Chloroflexota bacterium]
MRVVVDTNIIVSGYLGGALKAIITAWKTGKFTLIVSKEIAEEYLKVLRRPKFQIEPEEIDDFAALLLQKAEFATPREAIHVIDADPTDNKFLEAAVAGKAKLIVSGDGHLLEIKTFKGIEIVTAREFITRLQNQ